MATLAFVLARLFDPAQAGLVLAVVLAYRGPQPIVVAAAVAAVVSETVTLAAAVDYAWGERLLLRLAACLAQAAALARRVGVIRLARPGAGDGPRA
ncbi:MAG: hypothetical protein J2P50_20425, partial [Hyphomicrobiaceae bacterium]|nr:hypothetical protein [Hyphomicrobiaceae bacterium]